MMMENFGCLLMAVAKVYAGREKLFLTQVGVPTSQVSQTLSIIKIQ